MALLDWRERKLVAGFRAFMVGVWWSGHGTFMGG